MLAELASARGETGPRRSSPRATQSELAIAPPNGDIHQLTRARLRLADLQRRQGKSEDAIHTLERIDRNAPSDLYFGSRMQLAQCLEAKGDWRKAARTWNEVKASGQMKPADRGLACFHLGLCHAKLAQNAEARRSVEGSADCRRGRGPGGRPAVGRVAARRWRQALRSGRGAGARPGKRPQARRLPQ